jgi:hypothetical protein
MHVPRADHHRDAIVARLTEQADACVHLDPGRRGLMPTWLEALGCAVATDDGCPWSVVLSDDAFPLRGWQQHLERACSASPVPVLGLTHFGAYGEAALAKGAAYAVGSYLLWGGAIAFSRTFADGLLPWASKVYEDTGYPHDDVLACAYAMKMGWRTGITARAIFGQPVAKSLLNHNTPIRSPSSTISTTPGPSYRSLPQFVKVSRTCSPKGELERLAALLWSG